jgi:uncharacterized protein YcfL
MSKLVVLFFVFALFTMAGCAYWVNNRVFDEQRIYTEKESRVSEISAFVPKEIRKINSHVSNVID